MRLHDSPAVLHWVMFAVVFVLFLGGGEWRGGGGVKSMVFTTGLRCVITICPRANICFTQTLHFYRVGNAL